MLQEILKQNYRNSSAFSTSSHTHKALALLTSIHVTLWIQLFRKFTIFSTGGRSNNFTNSFTMYNTAYFDKRFHKKFCKTVWQKILPWATGISFKQLTSVNTPPPARLAWRQSRSFRPAGLEENFRDRMSQTHCKSINTLGYYLSCDDIHAYCVGLPTLEIKIIRS